MQINIKATNMELTPAIDKYIKKRLGKLKKLINKKDSGVLCEVEVGRTTFHHKKGDVFKAEINLTTEGKNFYAVAEESDLYAAIDRVKNEVRNSLLTYKEKKETLLKKGGAKVKALIKGFNWKRKK